MDELDNNLNLDIIQENEKIITEDINLDKIPEGEKIMTEDISLYNIVEEICENKLDGNYSEIPNCLALTIQKDYNYSVFKNIIFRTIKGAWKISLSFITLNFIEFFL